MSQPEPQKPVADAGDSAERVLVTVGDAHIPVTLQDGQAIRAALLEQLRRSKLDDRDLLLTLTEKVPNSIDNGVMKIGVWELGQENGQLTVDHVEPSGEKTSKMFTAVVVKDGDQWKVQEVRAGWIHWR